MISFYIAAVVLVFFGLGFALWPLIAKKNVNDETRSDIVEREEVNVALYKDHISELEKSLDDGVIDQAQFDSLKQEVERNLLEDSENKSDSAKITDQHKRELSNAKTNLVYTGLALVAVPIIVIVFYQYLGNINSWNLQSKLEDKTALTIQLSNEPQSLQLQSRLTLLNTEIAVDLQKHLQSKPDDLDSRVLLARTAVEIEDFDLAIQNYQSILEQQPDASQIMAELAQAVFVKTGNQVIPVVPMLAERALKLDPNNVIALGLMGIADFQVGNYQNAVDYWDRAVAIYPPNSANGMALKSGIEEAKVRLAAQPETALSKPEPAKAEAGKTEATVASKPSASNPAADHASSKTESASISKIKVAVSIGDKVPAKPEYTVFVYARAWQGARLPLAITRITAAQLPLTLELNDSMNMAPGLNLSSAEKVEVIARISPSGNAITQPDDWLVSIGPIDPKTASTTVYPLVISSPASAN